MFWLSYECFSALLHFRTPLGLGLGLRQSFQLRFFMMSHQKQEGGGGYESAIAPVFLYILHNAFFLKSVISSHNSCGTLGT